MSMDMDTRKKLAEITHPTHVHDYELSEEEREMRQAGLDYLAMASAAPYQWEWENFGLSGHDSRCTLCGQRGEPYFTWIWKFKSKTAPATSQFIVMCTEREACKFRAAVRTPL